VQAAAGGAVVANLPLPGHAAIVPRGVQLGAAKPFSFEALQGSARALAKEPWREAPVPDADIVARIDYDAYQKIRFRPELSLRLDGGVPIQFFHRGKYCKEPVRLNLLKEGGARRIIYSASLYDMPSDHVARALGDRAGFAGFRCMAPSLDRDWLAVQGASYFRAAGPHDQYGLSARGIAIDTAMPQPEEFPRFTEFWLESSVKEPLTIYSLLEGPSVTGAYRMAVARAADGPRAGTVDMQIEAVLYARRDVARMGIAPLSSMFWYGEGNRAQAADWRPEIHDSDGLAIWTGAGERIWRPLNNPPSVMTNTFLDRDVKGFGLLQRDRNFADYLDDGVFYERRPSVWIEPIDKWGEGAVHLVEIPTQDETSDNIVAYWCPAEPVRAGDERRFRYRLSWLDDIAFPPSIARAMGTWNGIGGNPGQQRPKGVRKFVIDFEGAVFEDLDRRSGVALDVTVSRGQVANAYSHPVVGQNGRWRAVFDVVASGPAPVDMRAFLKRGGQALSETWVYQYFPLAAV